MKTIADLIAKLYGPDGKLDRKKLVLVGIFAVMFLYVDYSFVLRKQLKALQGSKAQVARLKADIANVTRDATRIDELKKQKDKTPIIKPKRVISEGQVAEIVDYISDIAREQRVNIKQIKPAKDAAKPAVEKMAPLILNLEVVGGYHEFGAFINALENGEILFGVESIKLMAKGPDMFKHTVTLTLLTYVKK